MGVNLFEIFAGSRDLEEQGKWVDLDDSTAIQIRAMGAQSVLDLREELMRPYQALIRAGGEIPKDKMEDIGLRVISGAVIANWRGVRNAEGAEVAYSAEEAYAICKALPRFAGFVISYAQDAQNFKDEAKKDGAKNS